MIRNCHTRPPVGLRGVADVRWGLARQKGGIEHPNLKTCGNPPPSLGLQKSKDWIHQVRPWRSTSVGSTTMNHTGLFHGRFFLQNKDIISSRESTHARCRVNNSNDYIWCDKQMATASSQCFAQQNPEGRLEDRHHLCCSRCGHISGHPCKHWYAKLVWSDDFWSILISQLFSAGWFEGSNFQCYGLQRLNSTRCCCVTAKTRSNRVTVAAARSEDKSGFLASCRGIHQHQIVFA